MFRIIRDPASGSSLQCLAKITLKALSSVESASLDCAAHTHTHTHTHAHTHTHHGQIFCHNTDYVHINGRNRTITEILAKHSLELPNDGSLVIRNMLEQF